MYIHMYCVLIEAPSHVFFFGWAGCGELPQGQVRLVRLVRWMGLRGLTNLTNLTRRRACLANPSRQTKKNKIVNIYSKIIIFPAKATKIERVVHK